MRTLDCRDVPRRVSTADGFKNNAHNAGAKVNALMNDMPTATAIVRPNCLKKMPVVPPMNDTGMKITINTRVVVNSVTANPFMASTEAL